MKSLIIILCLIVFNTSSQGTRPSVIKRTRISPPNSQSNQVQVIPKVTSKVNKKSSAKSLETVIHKRNPASVALSENELQKMTIDFVDTDIQEVVRTISTAYGLSIITDNGISGKVNIHLEDVPVIEGLEALCEAHGFEVIREGAILKIRKASEKTKNILKMNFQRIDLEIENREVKEFIRDFAKKTGLKILAGSDLSGTVSGTWKNQIPLDGFKALMEAHGFKIKKRNGFYIVNGSSSARGSSHKNSANNGTMNVEVNNGKVSVHLENADLQSVIRDIAEQSGLNIVFYGQSRDQVNATLENVSVDEVFSTLLKGTNYTYVISDEGTLLVGEIKKAGMLLTSNELYRLHHVQAQKVIKLIPKSFKTGMQLTEVLEQNAILMTGTKSQIDDMKRFLDLIDVPTLQVLLECVIVEFKQGEQFELGLRTANNSSPTPKVEMFAGVQGQRYRETTNKLLQPQVGWQPTSFNLELSSLEASNKAKVLARPSITTLNGNKASIKVTNTMYYEIKQVNKDGQPINDFRPINDGITLDITPAVTHGDEITIEIRPEIKTTSPSSAGGGPRDVSTRTLNTTVKLSDGQTVRLGGLIQSSVGKVKEHVPLLGSIPLLGWLFSYTKEEEVTTELVIYITPHIIREGEAVANIQDELKLMDKNKGFNDAVSTSAIPKDSLDSSLQINIETINLEPVDKKNIQAKKPSKPVEIKKAKKKVETPTLNKQVKSKETAK